MTTYKCVHVVTISYFWSHKKDSGHAIQLAVGENPMLRAHFTALRVIDAKLLAIEFLTCTEVDTCRHPLRVYLLWTFFGPVTLSLT